jgi:hypothetical protein
LFPALFAGNNTLKPGTACQAGDISGFGCPLSGRRHLPRPQKAQSPQIPLMITKTFFLM